MAVVCAVQPTRLVLSVQCAGWHRTVDVNYVCMYVLVFWMSTYFYCTNTTVQPNYRPCTEYSEIT